MMLLFDNVKNFEDIVLLYYTGKEWFLFVKKKKVEKKIFSNGLREWII